MSGLHAGHCQAHKVGYRIAPEVLNPWSFSYPRRKFLLDTKINGTLISSRLCLSRSLTFAPFGMNIIKCPPLWTDLLNFP